MIRKLLQAVLAYVEALRLIPKLGLWWYVLVPGLLSLLLGGMMLTFVFSFADDLGLWATSWYTAERGGQAVTIAGSIVSGLLLLGVFLLLFKYVLAIIVGPFMSPLSERIEGHLLGKRVVKPFSAQEFAKDFMKGLGLSLRNLCWELALTIPLLILGLIPIFTLFTTITIFGIQAYYAGFGNIDFTLERHLGFRGRVQFVRAQRGTAIGNGLVYLGLLLTGIGFLFAPPLATIAATLKTVEALEESKRV